MDHHAPAFGRDDFLRMLAEVASGEPPSVPLPPSLPPPPSMPPEDSPAGMIVGIGCAVFVLLSIFYYERTRFKMCCTQKRKGSAPAASAPATASV